MPVYSPNTELAEFINYLRINGKSPNTVRAYKSDLIKFLSWPDRDNVNLELDVAEYVTYFRSTWSPATTNRKLSAFKCYAKWAGMGQILQNYSPPKTPPGIAHPIPEGMEGILKLVDCTDNQVHRALVALGGLCGLRVSETRLVKSSHFINHGHNNIELKVFGKGSKTRIIPVALRAWISVLPQFIACSLLDERLVPLSDKQARRIITQLGVRAGLSQPISSHDLRMTFGTAAYYNSGGDIRAVQELLGHASSHTTENYTQVSMEAMRKAAEIV